MVCLGLRFPAWRSAHGPVDLRFLEALNRSPAGVVGGEWLAWMGVDRDRTTEPDRIFGVRRADDRHDELRHAGPDGQRRPPHRAVRRHGGDAGGDERRDRLGRRARRAVRPGVAGGDDHRPDRRPRRRGGILFRCPPGTPPGSPGRPAWRTSPPGAVHRADGDGGRPDRGVLPARRRGPVLGLPEVPGRHGRGQRRRPRRHPRSTGRCRSCRGCRPARRRHRRRGRRLRVRPRRQPDGRGVPRSPVHRLRLLRSRDRRGPRRGRTARA